MRVIPATGDPLRHNRDTLSPTPPPSYMDIYPDLAEDRPTGPSSSSPPSRTPNEEHMFPPISLSTDDPELLDHSVCMHHLDPNSIQHENQI